MYLLALVYLISMNNTVTLAQLDKDWELALARNTRIHIALVCLINDNVRLLQRHSHKTLEEVG